MMGDLFQWREKMIKIEEQKGNALTFGLCNLHCPVRFSPRLNKLFMD